MKKLLSLVLALTMALSMIAFAHAEEPVTLTWYSIAGGVEGEIYDKMVALWNETHPDVQLTRVPVVGDSEAYYMKLSTAFASGDGPDIFDCSAAEFLKYVNNGIAMPVNEYIEPTIDDWYETAVAGVSINGNIYAFPCPGGDLLGLYCNVDMFEAAGLELPTTWQETYDAAQKLATDDVYGIQIQTRDQNFYGGFEQYPFMWMCGGDVLSEDGKTVTVNSQATIDAFQFYRDLANSDGGNLTPESSNSDITAFATGRVAMQICGSWAMWALQEEQYADLNWTVLPYPVRDAGMTSASDKGGWHQMVSAVSKHAKEAGEAANFLFNSAETTPLLVEHNNTCYKFSSRKSVLEQVEAFKVYPASQFVTAIAPVARMEPRYPSTVAKAYGEAFEEVIFNTDRTVADIVAELETKCIAALAE